MNKKLISAAVLAGIASTASAVNVNSDGVGQLLLYPYFSANNGNATNIAIVNTTNQTKAVKVRFNEGGNSWEVFDFNLYLSPFDVWTGGVTMAKDGSAPMVYTNDKSCTVPELKNYEDANAAPASEPSQKFRTVNIDSYAATSGENTNVSTEDRIKEGYIEVIEMGNVVNLDGVLTAPVGSFLRTGFDGLDFPSAIEHVNGVPRDCETVRQAWSSNALSTDPHVRHWFVNSNGPIFGRTIVRPTGGLFGIADIINVEDAVDRAYDALALDNVYAGALHSKPGTAYPDLGGNYISSSFANTASNANSGLANVWARVWNNNSPSTVNNFRFDTGGTLLGAGLATIKAITSTLQSSAVQNYFYADTGLSAMSDWVGKFGYMSGAPGALPLAPFTTGFNIPVTLSVVDNEEGTVIAPLDFSPAGGVDSRYIGNKLWLGLVAVH